MVTKHEYNPPTGDPHIPDVRNCGCATCRELDALRAENERLTRERDAARMMIGPLSNRPDLVDATEDVVRGVMRVRAEAEHLRAELRTCQETLTACLEVPL
jgi:hypothetical protein